MDICLGTAGAENGVWYIPDYGDNRESDNPAEFLLTPLSGAEMVKIEHSNVAPKSKSKDVLALMEQRHWAIKMKTLEKHVIGLKNWFIVDEKGTRKEAKNFVELREAILVSKNPVAVSILNDTYAALLDQSVLEEGMRKNSD